MFKINFKLLNCSNYFIVSYKNKIKKINKYILNPIKIKYLVNKTNKISELSME